MTNNHVGRAFRRRERYTNDEEYRERKKAERRHYYYNHREKYLARNNKWHKILSIFADKHCKICNKRLDYRTKSGLCFEHKWINYEKKN